MSEPLPTADNGRLPDGRFGTGNKAGKGNPLNRRAQQIRSALLRAVKPSDVKAAAERLLAMAKEGDRQAFAELLDRTIGRPAQGDLMERIEALEQLLSERTGTNGRH